MAGNAKESTSDGEVGRVYIQKIKVTNFMCHDNMEVELGPYTTFIIGRNGSGKSAVLTALCVGMGTKAKTTKRASSMKDFIKHGCAEATVEIHFRNVGEDRFQPDVYGDTVIVHRKIGLKSSSFAMRDGSGRKVKDGKAEVEKFAEHIGLDVDNPCSVLSQDQSREFLHSGNPNDRYKFFVHSTKLLQIQECLVEAKNKVRRPPSPRTAHAVHHIRMMKRKIRALL